MHYLREVKQSELKKIGKSLNKFNNGVSDLHLDNIFGTKKRISFPIGSAADSRVTAFMDSLKELGINLSVDDLKTGMITKQVQTQRGTQARQLRLATYLNGLKREGGDPAKIDDLIQTWSVIKDRLSQLDMGSSYSVVVSRYPLDILRMSDHVDDDGGEIESCHSPDGGWYHCAIKEAHIGGAVAYAVNTSDLAKVDLQAKEIFRDKDRAVNGIFPLERVRLRRFHNESSKIDILVPEIRTYPMKSPTAGVKKISGFHEAVVAWAKKVQARDIAKIDPANDYDDFDLRGGAYQDHKADVIWNNFFDVDISGEKESKDQSNNNAGKQTAENLENEAGQFIRHHRLRHIDVNFEGHDDGQGHAWGSWDAKMDFELDGGLFIKFPKDTDLTIAPFSYERKKPENSLVIYLQKHHQDIQFVSVERADEHYVNISMKLTDPDGDRRIGGGQMHHFEHFLDRLSGIDANYAEIEEHLMFWFAHNGFTKNHAKETADNYSFRHFTMEASAFKQNPKYTRYKGAVLNSYEIESEWADIGDLSGITKAHVRYFNFVNGLTYISGAGLPQPPIPKFAQRLVFKDRNMPSFKLKLLSGKELSQEDRLLTRFEFMVDYNEEPGLAKKVLAGISVIDRDWYKYIEAIKQWWAVAKAEIIRSV